MKRFLSLAAVLLPFLASPSVLRAQGTPVGPEFQVNTYTTSDQYQPRVASASSGDFVVVWTSFTEDGSSNGVFAQRYASSGTLLGPEFQVNTYTTGNQRNPAVSSDASLNFVVVWESPGQDGAGKGVFGRRYASSGAPLGFEFLVNTFTTGDQGNPSVASDPSGNIVVVWESFGPDGFGFGVFGQRYAASGAASGSEFKVNTYTSSYQRRPAVSSDAVGNFVVVWDSYAQAGPCCGADFDIFGQRFGSSGAAVGPEFQVNTYTTNRQYQTNVAMSSSGAFVVVWMSNGQDGPAFSVPPSFGNLGVFGQRYASSGAPLGPEFQVNTYTTGNQYSARVASDSSGNFVVVWDNTANSLNGSFLGISGQRYSGSGAALGSEFRVNSYTTSTQWGAAAVSSDPSGAFVVVWNNRDEDDGLGVFGQRYGSILPVELTRFTAE